MASPNNGSYEKVIVSNGTITLNKAFSKIIVGLPFTSDIETLDIDTPQGETLADKKMLIQGLSVFLEESRGVWVGAKPPSDDSVNALEGLRELKLRDTEGYDDSVDLLTGKDDINITGEWNNNGRVFIRQVDPIPMTILSIAPSGLIPFR